MISVEDFVTFMRRNDLGRIKFALREIHFDLNCTDENGRTVLHHALLDGVERGDTHITNQLLAFGADVMIKDETPQKESPLQIALRSGSTEFIRTIISSPSFDVLKIDRLDKQKLPKEQRNPSADYPLSQAFSCHRLPSVVGGSPLSSKISLSSIDSCCTTSESVVTQIERKCFGIRPISRTTSHATSCSFHDNQHITSQPSSVWTEFFSCSCCSGLLMVRQNLTAFVDSLQPPVIGEEVVGDSRDCLTFQKASPSPVSFFPLQHSHQQHINQHAQTFKSCEMCHIDETKDNDANDESNKLYNHCTSPHYSDIIIVQDESSFTPFCEFLSRTSDPKYLRTLIIVDCKLQWDPQKDPFSRPDTFNLSTLILSKTKIKKLPLSIFEMSHCLKVLKVDCNYLEEIPEKLASLTKLETFSCNSQKPRLRFLPKSIAGMISIKILSVCNNRLDDISWACGLNNLKVLKCSKNKLCCLPPALSNLKSLQVLDISYNRISHIPVCLSETISRLYRFDYFNSSLKPTHIQSDVSQLIKHLDLLSFLEHISSRAHVFDVSIGVVGESQSGKATLVDYLNQDRFESSFSPSFSSSLSSWIFSSYYSSSTENNQFIKTLDSCPLFRSSEGIFQQKQPPVFSAFVSAVKMNKGSADQLSKLVNVDIFLLTIDISTIQPHPSCHPHFYHRHMSRLQMWLESLYELSPNTPVVIAGTHADHVKNSTYSEIWSAVEEILQKGKQFHLKRYSNDQRHHACLLCNQPSQYKNARKTFSKGRSTGGMLGCVDGSELNAIKSTSVSASQSASNLHSTNNLSSATLLSLNSIDVYNKKQEALSSSPPSASSQSASSLFSFGSRYKFPHVLAYYEVDARKIVHKISKKKSSTPKCMGVPLVECYTAEQLKRALVKLTCEIGKGNRIPKNWTRFLVKVTSFSSSLRLPFVSYEDAKSVARSCDVPFNQLQRMLAYFHWKGKLVYFSSDAEDQLSRLVVTNLAWFCERVNHLNHTLRGSLCSAGEVFKNLADKRVDLVLQQRKSVLNDQQKFRKLNKALQTSTLFLRGMPYQKWLLNAIIKLDTCLVLPDSLSTPAFLTKSPYCIFFNSTPKPLFPIPFSASKDLKKVVDDSDLQENDLCLLVMPLLEDGCPNHNVWPEQPEWEEKQIVCEFNIRLFKPGAFTDFLRRLNREGRKFLKIVSMPPPLFMAHHVVFFSAADESGCDDCYNHLKKLRSRQRCNDEDDFSVVNDLETCEDLVHKVRVSLKQNMESVMVFVRGARPCCVMNAVLNFTDLHFDDLPETDTDCNKLHATSATADTTSSFSSHTASSSLSPSTSILYSSDGLGSMASLSHYQASSDLLEQDDEDKATFLSCHKCLLLRNMPPSKVTFQCAKNKRWNQRNIAQKTMSGAMTFDVPSSTTLTILPDYEHPRLVLILPPSRQATSKEWYLSNKTGFLEGLEVHFLCEYTAFWHLTEDLGHKIYKHNPLSSSKSNTDLAKLVDLALSLVQVIQGIPEHHNNVRLVSPIVPYLIETYDYLKSGDPYFSHSLQHKSLPDHSTWLHKNKERVVTMLSKVLTSAGDGMSDLYFKVNNPINANSIFQSASSVSRSQMARFLRRDNSSGRFGCLRPIYIESEIRWVCDLHYDELKSAFS